MSRDEPILDEQFSNHGRSAAEALGKTLDHIRQRVVEHLPDLIAARPGTRMVVECRSEGRTPNTPSFEITLEIARLRDREQDA